MLGVRWSIVCCSSLFIWLCPVLVCMQKHCSVQRAFHSPWSCFSDSCLAAGNGHVLIMWFLGTNRVPTPQGKQGKWWKVIPDRENTGILKILGKHREFGNLRSPRQDQENRIRFYILSFKWCNFSTKIHRKNWNHAGKTKGKCREFYFPSWIGTIACILGCTLSLHL